ncbi:MAG: GOLPH3/VPS74 family protein [Promethearchaeota archaeon]
MLISEALLLLLFNEKKGKDYSFVYFVKGVLLAGALLMDLFHRKKVILDDQEKVILIDPQLIGISCLDDILIQMRTSKKEHKLKAWINHFHYNYRDYHFCLMKKLEEKSIIQIEEYKVLKIFPLKKNVYFRRFSLKNEGIKVEIIKKLNEFVEQERAEDIEQLCLLSLLEAGHHSLIKKYISSIKYNIQAIKLGKKLKKLMQSESIDSSFRYMLSRIIKMIHYLLSDGGYG